VENTRKPSAARRPATARDCVSLALVRFAHEDAAARLVPAVLAGSGDGRSGLALSESTRTVDGSPSDVAGWTGAYVAARPARRCRLPVSTAHRRLVRFAHETSASLATDHSGRAGALRTTRARSGPKCMCPRRQRVSARGCAA